MIDLRARVWVWTMSVVAVVIVLAITSSCILVVKIGPTDLAGQV